MAPSMLVGKNLSLDSKDTRSSAFLPAKFSTPLLVRRVDIFTTAQRDEASFTQTVCRCRGGSYFEVS